MLKYYILGIIIWMVVGLLTAMPASWVFAGIVLTFAMTELVYFLQNY